MKNLSKIIIAHRGESHNAPENTLAAINLAWEKGAKAVEIDIQLTKDNEIVVFHDKDTARLSGKKLKISKSTLQELKLLNIGCHKGDIWKNERIPTLKDVLKTVPENAKLIIEIKSDESILDKLKDVLVQSELKDAQLEIIDFNIKTLAKAKTLMPNYKMLWLLDLDYLGLWWILRVNKKRILQNVKKHKLDGVNVWAGRILNQDFITKFKEADLFVYCWTVNDPQKASILLWAGIDGITTDRAMWMREKLGSVMI